MRKVILGKTLDQDISKCNFCQEEDKRGVRGERTIPELVYEFKDISLPNKRFFGIPYDYRVLESKDIKLSRVAVLICEDCIKQLAKQI